MFQSSEAFVKKFQDALTLLRVEVAQFAVNLDGELNLPSHAASEHPQVERSALPRCGYDPGCARPDTGPQGHPGAQGWLRGHRKSWCGPCGGRASPGVFQWI